MGCVFAYVILLTVLGPERKNRDLSADEDTDLLEATGRQSYSAGMHAEEDSNRNSGSDEEKAFKN